jgi:hypothetical protein
LEFVDYPDRYSPRSGPLGARAHPLKTKSNRDGAVPNVRRPPGALTLVSIYTGRFVRQPPERSGTPLHRSITAPWFRCKNAFSAPIITSETATRWEHGRCENKLRAHRPKSQWKIFLMNRIGIRRLPGPLFTSKGSTWGARAPPPKRKVTETEWFPTSGVPRVHLH